MRSFSQVSVKPEPPAVATAPLLIKINYLHARHFQGIAAPYTHISSLSHTYIEILVDLIF
jgi:hypothetical protein